MQREVLSVLLPGGVLRATLLQVILAVEAIFALYMLLGTLMGGLSDKVFEDVLKLRGVKEVIKSTPTPDTRQASMTAMPFNSNVEVRLPANPHTPPRSSFQPATRCCRCNVPPMSL